MKEKKKVMAKQLEAKYNPSEVEDRTYKFWLDGDYFHAEVEKDKKRLLFDIGFC